MLANLSHELSTVADTTIASANINLLNIFFFITLCFLFSFFWKEIRGNWGKFYTPMSAQHN
jgi:preprotein translocase subunit SecY